MYFFNHPIILFNVSEKLPYNLIPIRGKEKKTTMTKMSLTNTIEYSQEDGAPGKGTCLQAL